MSTEKALFDQHDFGGEGRTEKKVAGCRITFINQKNIITFLFLFNFV